MSMEYVASAGDSMWFYAVVGMALFAIFIIAYMVFVVYPHYKRKKILNATNPDKGVESALPTVMNAKTNPRHTKGEEFVDITSEPNPFLIELEGHTR